MSAEANIWVRLVFSPSTGRITVDGDPVGVLSLAEDTLLNAENPLELLPPAVVRALNQGGDVMTDKASGLVIIPGDTRYHNSVTVLRQKAQEADLVSDLAAGIVDFSPDGKILRWNRRMSYLFGPREKDVVGRKAADILPAPVLYDWNSVVNSAHLGHEVRIEFRPSGEKRVEGILSQGGTGVIGIFFDSTEGYKTGKRLRALNRLNQAYLQSTATGLLLLDSQLRILLSNPGFSRISGERGSFIGQQLHDVLPEESYKWIHNSSERLYGEERSEQSAIVPFKRKDGTILTLNHILRAVRNEMNQAVNYVCLFEDRTELNAVRMENDKLRKSMEGITRLSGELGAGKRRNGDTLCGKIMRLTGSKAVVEYTFDKAETLRQSGCAGSWPDRFHTGGPGALGFPTAAWSDTDIRTVERNELGKLSSLFSRCVIVPIGSGAGHRGFLLLCDSLMNTDDSELLRLTASLTGIILDSQGGGIQLASSDKIQARAEQVFSGLLGSLPFPAGILTRSELPLYWNPAMEKLTGLSCEEVTTQDVKNIIDPQDKGFSLDSLSATESPQSSRDNLVWKVRRRDDSLSRPFRWHVTILEQPALFKGDYGFLVAGIPVGEGAGDDKPSRGFIGMIRSISKAATAVIEHDVLEAVWHLLSDLDCCAAVEFLREGVPSASFPQGSSAFKDQKGETGPMLLIDGTEYEVRSAGTSDLPVLESVCELVTRLRGSCPSAGSAPEGSESRMNPCIAAMSATLEELSSESIKHGKAILNLVEDSDPFSGFARTLLLSQETVLRIGELIRLSLSIQPSSFRKVSLRRFMSGFPSGFVSTGLRPPSLSLPEDLPQVVIIPVVVQTALSRLCRIYASDSLIALSVETSKEGEGISAVLKISGLAGGVTEADIEEGFRSLHEGKFTAEAEAAFISILLENSGCRIIQHPESQCSILFSRTEI